MQDKLVTLAIHTFQKAQMIKLLLESEGIEVYLHNVNLIQPVISSGVRIRIKESDLPRALKIIENNPLLEKENLPPLSLPKILIPVDFSDYSFQACEIGFSYAAKVACEVVLFHSFLLPNLPNPLAYSESYFSTGEQEVVSYQKVKAEVKNEFKLLEAKIQEKIASKEWSEVPFSTKLESGLPEETIIEYARKNPVRMIVMGTRGKDRKDLDLIGSVTADVISQTKIPVLAIPENTPFHDFSEVKRIAFGTSFDQKDLIAVDSLINLMEPFEIEYSLFHLSHKKDAWNEIKLAGIKEYYGKQYPNLNIKYEIIDANDFLVNMERFVNANQIDLISLATHKRNLFTRLFNPSVAHKMLFHTDTPLLAFHV
ncbi:universal stress protein [Bacteroidales bacterium OttesenSCG-928-J19]|nr:universal stress protein [Bacteroidales bacterium OttesenSCG-928-J19]